MMQRDLFDRRPPDTAAFSADGVYRWQLTRELGGERPLVVCGLNPSTATAEVDDPTIRREIGFARLWDCGRLVKVNAYGFRATDPKVMKAAKRAGSDIVGPENDGFIGRACSLVAAVGGVLLVAWGRNIERDREAAIAAIIRAARVEPMCLGIDKRDGSPFPEHPLYVPYERPLRRWPLPGA